MILFKKVQQQISMGLHTKADQIINKLKMNMIVLCKPSLNTTPLLKEYNSKNI